MSNCISSLKYPQRKWYRRTMNYEYHFHTYLPVSTVFRSVKRLDDVHTMLCIWCTATFPFSPCENTQGVSRDRRLCYGDSNGKEKKEEKKRNKEDRRGEILQRVWVRVIYTLEKLSDIYDTYSRIIYSGCLTMCNLQTILFYFFFSFLSFHKTHNLTWRYQHVFIVLRFDI